VGPLLYLYFVVYEIVDFYKVGSQSCRFYGGIYFVVCNFYTVNVVSVTYVIASAAFSSLCVLGHIYRGPIVSVAMRTDRQIECEWRMKNTGIEVKDEH
jgi:hypothetical protein